MSRAKFNKTKKVEAIKNIYSALSIPELTEKKIESYFKKGFLKFKTLDCPEKKKTELINFTELLIGRES